MVDFVAVISVLIILLTICQNVIILITVCVRENMKTAANVFAGCLGASALLTAFVPMPMYISIEAGLWMPSLTGEKVLEFLDGICSTVLILSLTAISLDRCYAIRCPYSYARHVDIMVALRICVCLFSYGLVVSGAVFMLSLKAFTLLKVIVSYIMPTLIMTACYVNIALLAKKHATKIYSLQVYRRSRLGFLKKSAKVIPKNSPLICKPTPRNMSCFKGGKDIPESDGKCDIWIEVRVCDQKNTPKEATEPAVLHLMPNYNPKLVCVNDTISVGSVPDRVKDDISNNSKTFQRKRLMRRSTSDVSALTKKKTFRKKFLLRQSSHPSIPSRNGNILKWKKVYAHQRFIRLLRHLRKLRFELKASITLVLVMGCLFCLWTPYVIFSILRLADQTVFTIKENRVHLKPYKLLQLSSAAINSICFVLSNRKWRKAFKYTLKAVWSKTLYCDLK